MAIDTTDRVSSISDQILRQLARQATGMSGAEIAFLVNQARGTARREKRNLTIDDLEEALMQRKPAKHAELRLLIAYHEAGHAVAQIHFDLGSIKLITINGANGAAYVAGSVHELQEASETTLTALIIIKLAGREAEQEFLGLRVHGLGRSPRQRPRASHRSGIQAG